MAPAFSNDGATERLCAKHPRPNLPEGEGDAGVTKLIVGAYAGGHKVSRR